MGAKELSRIADCYSSRAHGREGEDWQETSVRGCRGGNGRLHVAGKWGPAIYGANMRRAGKLIREMPVSFLRSVAPWRGARRQVVQPSRDDPPRPHCLAAPPNRK